METLNNIVLTIQNYMSNYILVIALLGAGLWFSIRLGFIQVRGFGESMRRTFGGLFSKKGEAGADGMSSFQALATAIAAQVGTGNIAGAATALAIGGPGAIFWMWIAAFLGMATIYAEAIMAQKYKTVGADGQVTGGPVYYIRAAFKGTFGKVLAGIFAILITLALGFMGNAVQSNSIAASFHTAFGIPQWIMGLVVAVIAIFVFMGGMKRIAKVTETIVPFMAALYIIGSLIVIIYNYKNIPYAFASIFIGAFSPSSVVGGAAGATVKLALTKGVARGLFSNEAGMGSAPNAAATADTSHPVKQGLIQSLGVFTDTIIICTCTAFMVLLYTQFNTTSGATSIELAQEALSYHIGSLGYTFIAICIFLFAFSSIVGNYYYGQSNIEFIFGENKALMAVFRVLVVGMVLFGSLTKVQIVWDLADVMMALMAIVNLVAITLLGKFAFRALDDYTRQRKAGISNPTFNPANIEGLGKVECWGNDDDEEATI